MILVVGATAWSVVIVLCATFLPVETVDTGQPGVQPRHSLVDLHGYVVLFPASIPLIACAGVFALLGLSSRGSRAAFIGAWAVSVALTVVGIVGTVTFLIGAFVVPTGGLLIAATARSRGEQAVPAT
jgi:hypothetical protein